MAKRMKSHIFMGRLIILPAIGCLFMLMAGCGGYGKSASSAPVPPAAPNRQAQKNKELQDDAEAILERLRQKIHDDIDCADKREIIKTIVKEIIVYPKKRVEVTFKFYPPGKP